jgi:hypothetical protein
MDIGNLLSRTWNIVWNHKWLILLGFLAALGSGGGGGGGTGYNFGGGDFQPPTNDNFAPPPYGTPGPYDFDRSDLEQFAPQLAAIAAIGIPIVLGLLCIGLVIGIGLAVVARIAAGGLIAGVNDLDSERASSFGQAFRAGWAKGWRLIGIGLVAALPSIIAFFIALLLLIPIITVAATVEDVTSQIATSGGLIAAMIGIICLGALISLPLSLLRGLADRACMLEDTGVTDSYRRAWAVLRPNLGDAVLLALIHLGMQIAIGLVLFLPSLLIAFCCILWPVMVAVQGAILAYFSTMWTLAWRAWVAGTRPGLALPAPAPNV